MSFSITSRSTTSEGGNLNKKKDGKNDDINSYSGNSNEPKQLNVMQAIFGECLCADAVTLFTNSSKLPAIQFASLDGIECIGLGAVVDEQSSRERVLRTASQLILDTERLISVGYLRDGLQPVSPSNDAINRNKKAGELLKKFKKITESLPLDVWRRKNKEAGKSRRGSYSEFVLPLAIGSAVEHLKVRFCNYPFFYKHYAYNLIYVVYIMLCRIL